LVAYAPSNGPPPGLGFEKLALDAR
jgi:hypothetical protein